MAQSSLTDRLGALQEKAVRTIAVWKGHIGGYGRAAVSNAIAIVSRPEPKKTPVRPRLSREGGNSVGPGDFTTTGKPAARNLCLPDFVSKGDDRLRRRGEIDERER